MVAFFKDHPSVNEQLLDYAVTAAIFADKKNLAKAIPSPVEVDDVFFHHPELKGDSDDVENMPSGNDYSLYLGYGRYDEQVVSIINNGPFQR